MTTVSSERTGAERTWRKSPPHPGGSEVASQSQTGAWSSFTNIQALHSCLLPCQVQPSPDPRGWAVKSLMATPTTPFCLLAGSCLVPLPSPPPFSLSCFRGFQPLSFPPLFLPSPFSSSFSFTSSSSSLSLVWAHGRWRELPKSLCHGVSKGVLCPSSHIRAQHPPYPHLCTG